MINKTRDQLLKEFALKRELMKLIDRCVEIQLELELRQNNIIVARKSEGEDVGEATDTPSSRSFNNKEGTKKHGNTRF